jgi:DNA sulfur modification protein DndD
LQEATSTIHDLADIASEIKSIDRLLDRVVQGKISAADRIITKAEIDLTRIENEIEVLASDVRGHDTAEIARQRAHRDGLLREEGQISRDIEATRKDIESLAKELAIIDRQLKDMPSARARKSTALVTLISDLERIFGESVELLRERLRKDVEIRASEAFMHLTTQKTYRGLEINRSYGLSILDSQGDPVTVRSAGAEQIVALSLIDGLARTGRSAGPVIMDTPFGRLDLQHRDNILRYLPTTTSQLILLVHGGEIRRPRDLEPVASRVGASYEIREVNSRHSRIERTVT